jgi:hypothetical protein
MKLTHKEIRHQAVTLIQQLKNQPCVDCKLWFDYWVMDFDHTGDDKLANISQLARSKCKGLLDKIRREAAKCDVVCANCHRTRTHLRNLDKVLKE